MRNKLSTLILSIVLMLTLPTLTQGATLRTGSTGPEVRAIQTELNLVGHAPLTVDGYFGQLTRQRVVQFQEEQHITADGVVGPATEAALLHQTKTDAILASAEKYIGTPYLWGGTTPAGFDCSGFVQYVFVHNGITLRRVSADQARNGNEVAYRHLQPGDLMFFSPNENGVVSHVGIYIGDGEFLGSENEGVRIVTLNTYWVTRFVIARRVY